MKKEFFTVAIVDDEEGVRKAFKRLLRSVELRVTTYESGGAFLDSLSAEHPDCVVQDLHMPLMTGFDVMDQMQKKGIALPVVIITAHDSLEARERAMASGAHSYLRKPVDGQTLLDAITDAIAHLPVLL